MLEGLELPDVANSCRQGLLQSLSRSQTPASPKDGTKPSIGEELRPAVFSGAPVVMSPEEGLRQMLLEAGVDEQEDAAELVVVSSRSGAVEVEDLVTNIARRLG